MATPGWYPDPSGQAGRYRYWDGQRWGEDVTDNPYDAAPGAAPWQQPEQQAWDQQAGQQPEQQAWGQQAQQQPRVGQQWGEQGQQAQQPYGQQYAGGQQWAGAPQWSPMAPPQGSGDSGRKIGLVVGGVVLALLLLLVGGIFVGVALTGGDDDSASGGSAPAESTGPADEPSAEEPTDEPSAAEPTPDPGVACTSGNPTDRRPDPGDGRLHGGGLSFAPVRGYEDSEVAVAFTFAHDVRTQMRSIEANWASVMAVGELRTQDGFPDDPEQAAAAVMACMVGSENFYTEVTGTTPVSSEATTVDGNDAWTLREEIRVDVPGLSVEGDVTEVTVVDLGEEGTFGLFVGIVPIGDQALLDRLEKTVSGLRAD